MWHLPRRLLFNCFTRVSDPHFFRIRIQASGSGGFQGKNYLFYWIFFTFQMILNNYLKKLKKNLWKIFRLQIAWNGWLTQKTYVAFFPWCKNDSSIFFFSFQGFSERISCDPNPDSWSLNRRNKIVCIAHFLLYKIMIYSFLSFPIWPGSGHIFCGSGPGKTMQIRIRNPGFYIDLTLVSNSGDHKNNFK